MGKEKGHMLFCFSELGSKHQVPRSSHSGELIWVFNFDKLPLGSFCSQNRGVNIRASGPAVQARHKDGCKPGPAEPALQARPSTSPLVPCRAKKFKREAQAHVPSCRAYVPKPNFTQFTVRCLVRPYRAFQKNAVHAQPMTSSPCPAFLCPCASCFFRVGSCQASTAECHLQAWLYGFLQAAFRQLLQSEMSKSSIIPLTTGY